MTSAIRLLLIFQMPVQMLPPTEYTVETEDDIPVDTENDIQIITE